MNLRVLATAAFVACLMPALPLAVHAASPAAPTKSAQQQTPQKPSDAQPAPTHLGGGQGWDAYSDTEKGQKFCYLVGKPQKSEPASAKRDPIYASIAHRPADKAFNVVSFNAGYLFKENSDAELAVDGELGVGILLEEISRVEAHDVERLVGRAVGDARVDRIALGARRLAFLGLAHEVAEFLPLLGVAIGVPALPTAEMRRGRLRVARLLRGLLLSRFGRRRRRGSMDGKRQSGHQARDERGGGENAKIH